MDLEFSCKPIGYVESCYPDKFGTPRQPGLVPESEAFIRLSPSVQPEQSLQGLAGFSHLWVVFWFHKNNSSRFHAKIHPPRMQGDSIGVFATRSPHRPNPIGLSLLEIVAVEADGIKVRGIDLIQGTPVLDIKPYLPLVESIPGARQGWTQSLDPESIEVHWSESCLQSLARWQQGSGRVDLQALIEKTLQLDPRPKVYKGFEGQEESPYRQSHAVRFFDGDVHFQFTEKKSIEVLKVLHPFESNL